ncbi:hypothetical protein ACFLY6_01565 [Candidatus Dependentiae bacterium]
MQISTLQVFSGENEKPVKVEVDHCQVFSSVLDTLLKGFKAEIESNDVDPYDKALAVSLESQISQIKIAFAQIRKIGAVNELFVRLMDVFISHSHRKVLLARHVRSLRDAFVDFKEEFEELELDSFDQIPGAYLIRNFLFLGKEIFSEEYAATGSFVSELSDFFVYRPLRFVHKNPFTTLALITSAVVLYKLWQNKSFYDRPKKTSETTAKAEGDKPSERTILELLIQRKKLQKFINIAVKNTEILCKVRAELNGQKELQSRLHRDLVSLITDLLSSAKPGCALPSTSEILTKVKALFVKENLSESLMGMLADQLHKELVSIEKAASSQHSN